MDQRLIIFSLFLFFFLLSVINPAYTKPIPIRFCGNLIVIRATVNHQTGNFIIDTGTSNILLNARYFSGDPSDKYFVGITGGLQEMQVTQSTLQIGDLSWKNAYSQIVTMNLIETKAGIPIHGLIGSSLFRKYEVQFNYRAQQIEIHSSKRKKDASSAYPDKPEQSIAFRYKGRTPTISIALNGVKMRVVLDTGAEVNLMDLRTSKQVISDISNSRYRNIGGFGDSIKNRIVIPIPELKIGNLFLDSTDWTVIGSWDDLNYTLSGPRIQGILGHELFTAMKVSIDFRNKVIHLWPYPEEKITRKAAKNMVVPE